MNESTSSAAKFYTRSRRINDEYTRELAQYYFGYVPNNIVLRDIICGRFFNKHIPNIQLSFDKYHALARLLLRQRISPKFFLTIEGNFWAYCEYSIILNSSLSSIG